MRELLPLAERVASLLKARGETGATGPTANRYGDPAGHACLAVCGRSEHAVMIATRSTDRLANMHAFAAAALSLLAERVV